MDVFAVFQVQRIALALLEDVQPEVRVKASVFLSGLLHCQFISSPDDLLVGFSFGAYRALVQCFTLPGSL